jgi:hypothetical protein
MPSVKISELPILNQLSANNANTVFVAVDKTSNTTSQFPTNTLAAGLFANNVLNVGTQTPSTFPGLIAQFIANTAPYGQVNYQNANSAGSMDVVLTANIGNDANNYLDLGINNSAYADPQFSATKAVDGYLIVHGSSASDYIGNLVLGTAQAETNVLFAVGGTTNLDVVAKMTKNGLEFDNGGYITFDDGSTQTVAASPSSVTLAIQANTIITQGVDATQNTRLNSIETVNVDQNTAISIIQGVNTTQNTNITTANNHAWAAFTKANNALANTSGAIFAGNLNVQGNVTMIGVAAAGQLTVNTALTAATDAAVRITGSNNAVVIEPQNDGYMLQITGKENLPTRVVLDSFGANTYGLLAGRSARGTASAPTATQSGDVLLRLAGNGYGTTGFAPLGVSRIDIVAAENFTDAARGSRIKFYNVPDGSNTVTEIASFNSDSVEFTGTVKPDKGFIYVPTILVGNQTAFTIDFSTTSLIKATLAADCTISLSNYVYGKVVEVWLTNTGGLTRTITHGCTATNSSENATTFTMPGTSSAYLRYFSIDGDLANTFVAIQSA